MFNFSKISPRSILHHIKTQKFLQRLIIDFCQVVSDLDNGLVLIRPQVYKSIFIQLLTRIHHGIWPEKFHLKMSAKFQHLPILSWPQHVNWFHVNVRSAFPSVPWPAASQNSEHLSREVLRGDSLHRNGHLGRLQGMAILRLVGLPWGSPSRGKGLTHWSLGDVAVISLSTNSLQGIVSLHTHSVKLLSGECHRTSLIRSQHWLRCSWLGAVCGQATSHYLSQCWPRSMLSHGITTCTSTSRPQWVNPSCVKNLYHIYI